MAIGVFHVMRSQPLDERNTEDMAKKPTTAAAQQQPEVDTVAVQQERTTLPLNTIVEWPHNPRRTRDAARIAQRAKNLLSQGQLMPMIVVATGNGDFHFAIDGETRRLGMNLNVAAGTSEPDMPVDVKILAADTPLKTLLAIAMAVNTERDEMNPIEQMEGFTAMHDAGLKHRDIAEMYNLSVKQVIQRISLGRLVDWARDLVRTGVRQIGWAEAMTIGSPAQQQRVVAEIAANPSAYPDRASVHADFTRGNIPAESALFDAGLLASSTMVDLFSHGTGGGSFTDPDAFWKLQMAEVTKIVDGLKETHKEVRLIDRQRFNDAGWSTGGEPKKSVAVVVTYDDGSVVVREGMVPPAHEAKAAVQAAASDDGDFLSDGATFSDDLTHVDEAPVVKIETSPLDAAGRDTIGYLGAQVVAGLKVAVASDARKAMAFVIASTLTRNGGLASSMQINGVGIDARQQTSESFVQLTALRGRRDAIAKAAGILGVTSPAKVVALLLQMEDGELQELFAWTVAESVSTPLQNTTFDLVEALGAEPMPGWSIEQAYLDTLTTAQTRALAAEVVPIAEQPSRNATITQVRKSIIETVEADALQINWVEGQTGWLPPQISGPRAEARARADAAAQSVVDAAAAQAA